MNIEVNASRGVLGIGGAESAQVPLQIYTALVLAELLQIREAGQREQVEFMAKQNEKSKACNEALTVLSNMLTDYASEGATTLPNGVSKDGKGFLQSDLDKKDANGKQLLPPAVLTSVSLAMSAASSRGLSFVDTLKKMQDDKLLTPEQAQHFMGRAKMADLAREANTLPAGGANADYSALFMGTLKRGNLDAVKNGVKAAGEGITTNSQLFMIKLQQLVSLVDAIKTALSQFVKTSGEGLKEIMQKL